MPTKTVVTVGPPVTGDGSCCCGGEGQPCCGTTVPNTLYATFTSTCPAYNALTVVLTWNGVDAWDGTFENGDCDLFATVGCVDGVLSGGFSIGSFTVLRSQSEAMDCDLIIYEKTIDAEWYDSGFNLCCDGTTTMTVTL